jgi:hypothetical protein
MFINLYFEVKSIKLSEKKDGSYFIRISDSSALITNRLVLKIKLMMNDLREKVKQFHLAQGKTRKQTEKEALKVHII